MDIDMKGLHKKHEAAINKGFAPWNILRLFIYNGITVVKLLNVQYFFGGDVFATFEAAGHEFPKKVSCDLDRYELLDEI